MDVMVRLGSINCTRLLGKCTLGNAHEKVSQLRKDWHNQSQASIIEVRCLKREEKGKQTESRTSLFLGWQGMDSYCTTLVTNVLFLFVNFIILGHRAT